MRIRDLNIEDRIGWISMRAKLWQDEPIHKLINDTFIIMEYEGPEGAEGNWRVFILEEKDGRLCGFEEVLLQKEAEDQSVPLIGTINGLYIETSFRKHGFGRRFVEKAEEWCRMRGCRSMEAVADVSRKEGIELYKAMEYKMVSKDDKKVKFEKSLQLPDCQGRCCTKIQDSEPEI